MKKIALLVTLVFSSFIFVKAQDTSTVIIFHTNDMHGHLSTFPQAKQIIDSVKSIYKNVFVISAGDIFTGDPVTDKFIPDTCKKKTNKYYGYPIIDLMNKTGYNASEIGNHEFDYTIPVFKERERQADFPFLCANIDGKDTGIIAKPFIILKTAEGNKIFILGLLQIGKNGYPDSYIPKVKPIKFYNPRTVLNKYPQNIKDTVNAMILLSHLGSDTDVVIAADYPYFDVIIGGHTHKVVDTLVGNTLVVQAGKYMKYLGMTTIKIFNGKIVSKKDTLFDLKRYPNYDRELKKLVDKYEKAPYLDEVVAKANRTFTGDNELGKIITAAMLDFTGADIAFQNTGGIRIHEIPKGNITLRQIYAMSPFGNKYVVLEMTLDQIKEMILYVYALTHQDGLVAGGLDFSFVTKNGKITDVILKKDGKDLKNGVFKVVINDYMFTAYKINYKKVVKEYDKPDAEVIIDYLKKIKVVK